MKLWRRRPLSEDLSRKDLNIPEEMPPTLVYISPGNQRISKRSSLANNVHFSNSHDSSNISSYRINNAESNVKSRNDCLFQTFRDYECKYLFKFDEKTLEKNNISNKDCKSYLPPVSQEWSPVKDVMKICRSASVPFHFRNSEKANIQEINNINNQNLKSPHLSLSEKIKIFFRNRSTSRPSKPPLTFTLENNSPKPVMKQNKGINRISRSRIKDIERCKSLYEPKQVVDTMNLQNQTQLLDCKNSTSKCVTTMASKEISKFDRKNKFDIKDKTEKNIMNFTGIHKPMKVPVFNSESSQNIQLRKFSSSVSTHTSSVSKGKSNLHLTHEDHNCQKFGNHNNFNLNHQGNEGSVSNYSKSPYGMKYTKNYCREDTKVSHKPPETKTTPRWDKTSHLNTSNVKVTKSNRIDSKKCKQETEYLLPSRIKAPVMKDTENKFPVIDHRKYNNSNDEDYVPLAEVNMSSPINNAQNMSQSLYSSVLPDYLNVHNKYENKEINILNLRNCQQKNVIFQKDRHRIMQVGEIRKRPISCMTIVGADRTIPLSEPENNHFNSIFSKSPYLSQYSKLYSLRTNIELDLTHRYRNEIVENDLMTRSQYPSPYNMAPITKDQTGKLSTDSGLVDDINAFHPDCLQLTQNY